MTPAVARRITGGLSKPSKMPGHAYNTPAVACKVGRKLARVAGTVCASCYALKGRYRFPGVRRAMARRLRALRHPRWVEAMGQLIRATGDAHFRWHDSGDIQGVWHLEKICKVAAQTPTVQHWLPTREWTAVTRYTRGGGVVPPNLVIRYSLARVDPPASEVAVWRRLAPQISTVVAASTAPDAYHCPARTQGNRCGACRACWDPRVPHVAYPKH